MRQPFTIISVLLITLSCSNSSQQVIESWNNGEPRIIHDLDPDFEKSYTFREYNNKGQLITEGRIQDGLQQGQWIWWFDNGSIKDIANLVNGEYVGKRIHFNENGDTNQLEILYEPCIESCCFGQVIYYKRNKRLVLHELDSLGVTDGICYYFNPNGDTAAIFQYISGLSDGLRVEFQPNGQVSCFGNLEEGIEQGKWILFNILGSPVKTDFYENGEITASNNEVDTSWNGLEIMPTESKLEYYYRIKASN